MARAVSTRPRGTLLALLVLQVLLRNMSNTYAVTVSESQAAITI